MLLITLFFRRVFRALTSTVSVLLFGFLLCGVVGQAAESPFKASPVITTADDGRIHVVKGQSHIVKFAQPLKRVSIADPAVADVVPLSPTQLLIQGKGRGLTTLIVWNGQDKEAIFDIQVERDTKEIETALRRIAPQETVSLNVTDDSLIISGTVSNAVVLDEMRRLAGAYGYKDDKFVDLTDTTTPQIVLSVKIVQMSREIARDLKTSFGGNAGTNFTVTRLANPVDTNILSRIFPNPAQLFQTNPATGRDSAGLAPGFSQFGQGANSTKLTQRFLPFIQSGNNIGGITGTLMAGTAFQTALDFLESEGKASTLAEPQLVTTHGREASFLAGGEFPFIVGASLSGVPNIEFKEYGVGLKFTPWINPRTNLIDLKIAPEVSELDSSNCVVTATGNVCGLFKRTTNTMVQLRDNESLLISGILTHDETNSLSKVPFISDVPILGAFFKNSSKTKRDTELVVIVTPHVLTPASQASMTQQAQQKAIKQPLFDTAPPPLSQRLKTGWQNARPAKLPAQTP